MNKTTLGALLKQAAPLNDAIALAQRHGRGMAVLIEDMLDANPSPPQHPATAPVSGCALLAYRDESVPGLLLEDGSVVPLTWSQMFALREHFDEFGRCVIRDKHDRLGPSRASMEVPTT